MHKDSFTYVLGVGMFCILVTTLILLSGCATTHDRRPKTYKCTTIEHDTWAEFKCKEVR